ncbi:MAG: Gfo/Idh/MocA family oxidoreductase [Candidatus Omnitrophica bacterium]|nr:Gfo/Idh/MocA family oxidoreductase [Candidatus Omnitrophota bacterium]MCM8817859.1 Gfo/Idh/MocA family oxidoreductase [Candidatus Omnitrophota bacterium]
MTTQKLNVGIAGYGFIGKVHAYAYRTVKFYYQDIPQEINLIGVCASSEETRRNAIQQAGFEYATGDFMRLAEDKNINIISCCLPNHLHFQLVKAALEAGKHVYCDKPLALNVKEATTLVEMAKNTSVKTQVVFQLRFFPAIMRAKQLLENGYVGKVNFFRFMYLHSSCVRQSKKAYSWKAEYEKVGGGVLVDLGSHIIDLATYLVGDFKMIRANTKNITSPDKRTDDLAIVEVETKDGAIGILEASKIATGTNDEVRFEIYGSDGALEFNSMEPNWLYAYNMDDPDNPIGGMRGFKRIETVQRYPDATGMPLSKFSIGWIRSHVACLHSFLHSIIYDKPTSPSFEEALYVQKVIEGSYESSRTRKEVFL